MNDRLQAAGERPLRRIMLVIAYDGTNYCGCLLYTSESLIGSMLFSGGMMVSIIVIISSILVCEDFRSGFVKNLFSCRTKRGHYIFGKMLAFFAVNVIYMAVFILVILGLNKLMGFNISLGSPKHLLMMIGAGCLIITALIAQNLLFCMLTRKDVYKRQR